MPERHIGPSPSSTEFTIDFSPPSSCIFRAYRPLRKRGGIASCLEANLLRISVLLRRELLFKLGHDRKRGLLGAAQLLHGCGRPGTHIPGVGTVGELLQLDVALRL